MANNDRPTRTGVIVLKSLEIGVRLETRAVRVTFPFSYTLRQIEISGKPYDSVVEAIGYARSQGLTEMALRTLSGREGGVFPLMDAGANFMSDYIVSSVRSIQGEVPSNGHSVHWVVEKLSEVDKQYLSRPIMD